MTNNNKSFSDIIDHVMNKKLNKKNFVQSINLDISMVEYKDHPIKVTVTLLNKNEGKPMVLKLNNKTDKHIRLSIGTINDSRETIIKNIKQILDTFNQNRPAKARELKDYVRNINIGVTMGKSFTINTAMLKKSL